MGTHLNDPLNRGVLPEGVIPTKHAGMKEINDCLWDVFEFERPLATDEQLSHALSYSLADPSELTWYPISSEEPNWQAPDFMHRSDMPNVLLARGPRAYLARRMPAQFPLKVVTKKK